MTINQLNILLTVSNKILTYQTQSVRQGNQLLEMLVLSPLPHVLAAPLNHSVNA